MKNVDVNDDAPQIRFVDFCAGLGGFHKGLTDAANSATDRLGVGVSFKCVAASELEDDLRSCYVSNFPEIAETYKQLHGELTRFEKSKSKINNNPLFINSLPEFDELGNLVKIHGDMTWFLDDSESALRKSKYGTPLLPAHDLLCAGFPCQPFSKSGAQRGLEDTRGTVFHTIATILREHSPAFILLENVGNFPKHDDGNTWASVRRILDVELGYDIVATEHVGNGSSSGLISPHHLGFPHHRERFFMVGQRRRPKRSDSIFIRALLKNPLSQRQTFPSIRTNGSLTADIALKLDRDARKALTSIISRVKSPAEREDLLFSQISFDRVRCINHWGELLKKLDELDRRDSNTNWRDTMPSFPIWGFELDPWHWYPAHHNPKNSSKNWVNLNNERACLLNEARTRIKDASNRKIDIKRYPPKGERAWLAHAFNELRTSEWIDSWPGYAGKRDVWPRWKQRFIEQNREWAVRLWASVDPEWLREWLDTLYEVVKIASFQKLEWNCKGEDLDIWSHILQFRPSGLRVKRFAHVPALVAMTTTQIPIVPIINKHELKSGAIAGANGRHLIQSEALQLQGLPPSWKLPSSRVRAFTCFGNAVHVGVVHQVISSWLLE